MQKLTRTGMVHRLPEPLWDRLQALCERIDTLPPRAVMTHAGALLDHSALLIDGLMVRHVTGGGGNRQMVSLQVPGDFVDLHALPLGRLDHDVLTLDACRVALFPHAALRRLMAESEEDARAMWALTMIDASIHRHWTFRMGSLRAMAGLANFLCETALRLDLCGRGDGERYPIPLTQPELADVCGMSVVHIGRVLRDLREAGMCTLREGVLTIRDRAALEKAGNFDPGYLYLPWDPEAGG